jgi:hypothetical protein
MTGAERRRDPRLELDETAFLKIKACRSHPHLAGKRFYCSTRNVSKGGIMIFSDTGIPVDAYMELILALSINENTFDLIGIVRWTSETASSGIHKIGIQFLDTSPGKAAWNKLIEYLLKKRG